MKIMFDSGATTSFIRKSVLDQIVHTPMSSISASYFMADGYTRLKIIGKVKLCIQFDHLSTYITMGVVNSLCTDCVLGMDYINKYDVNLQYKFKQVQIHTDQDNVTIPMINKSDNVITSRLSRTKYLKQGKNVGRGGSGSNLYQISTVVNPHVTQKLDKNVNQLLLSSTLHSIDQLVDHMKDHQDVEDLRKMLQKHYLLFDTTRTTIAQTTLPHSICTGDHPPPTSRPYPQTAEKQDALFQILQTMLRNKQIRPSNSSYSSPVLLIKKADGSYRFVVDYRKLNNITIPDNFPLPNLEQSIQSVGGYAYYSKLDLRSGYFQIPIRESDRHKTAFITVQGLFEFNVLAQGLRNSPPSFQRIMSSLLLPCRSFCLVYLDDILIYSKTIHQHIQHLNQVLAILNKHQFQLNLRKCELVQSKITYLGHVINADGICPLPDRIEKILVIPQPKSLNQANAFIGAIGWYKKFIKDFSYTAAPILAVTNLTRNNRHKFCWGKEQAEAFEALKKCITIEPLYLAFPDPDAPLILNTDASDFCIGGVLYQDINGQRKNIYFHSQMLPKSQHKWPTIEKEALAIYHCVMRMKLFLMGREFIVLTDHCPLQKMHLKPSNNRRVDRISLVLQQFTIKEIRHVSGACNCMADYLTRYPCSREDDEEFLSDDFGEVNGIRMTNDVSASLGGNSNILPMINAVTTRAQARLLKQTRIEENVDGGLDDDVRSNENDQPPREEGHDFDLIVLTKGSTRRSI